MTKLLISVRSAAEALSALQGGAAIIDVKEPNRGSLGAADPTIWADVVRQVAGRVPVSVALGELIEVGGLRDYALDAWDGVAFAKLGLSGCRLRANWVDHWKRARDFLPASLGFVAVIYGDWEAASAPHPFDILNAIEQVDCKTVLIDTFHKDGRSLLDLVEMDELGQWCQAIRSAGRRLVLAGSLNANSIGAVRCFAPDLVAVRGAACESNRSSAICPQRVCELVEQISRQAVQVERADFFPQP